MCAGLRKNLGSFLTWSTLRKKCRLASGKRLRSTYQDLPKLMIIDTQWKYFLKSGNRNIWKHLISMRNFVSFLIFFRNMFALVWNFTLFCLWCFSNFRQDKAKAVEILVGDLKMFSTFNEELYKEITQLLTLTNFR